ncbi:MAG TPA: thiol:disulfide interchange protein DsbA/DsbL [Janthinobacterium sp.]|jgi:thiol:disulfide interchange protein DsbA|nr:thiol:disulfide interchange protein DsbA/DsbL [Janthinobacterium sp.]
MHFLKKVVCAVALCGVALAAMASPAEPKNGTDYLTLQTPQNTDAGKKIEVTEFFAYYCPHCYSFEPALEAWVKKQGANIVFKRSHVANGDSVLPQERLFFTLEALGLTEQYHAKVFQAMHVEQLRLNRDELVFDWAARQGIDRQKFIDTYRSFGVAARVRRADAMMADYKIDSWPTIAIDGRYITSPSSAGQGAQNEEQLHDAVLKVMDFLVAKAKAEKK